MRRIWTVTIVLTLTTASSSQGLTMRWSGGAGDLRTTIARTCTLLVAADLPEETLPQEWRIVWVSRSDAAVPLTISEFPPGEGYADVCNLSPASSGASIAARVDTVIHCASSVLRVRTARYLIDVAADVQARIAPLAPALPAGFAGTVGPPEVTINGGVADPYPPLLTSVLGTARPGFVRVEATGHYLGEVNGAVLISDGAGPSTAFEVESRSDHIVTLTASVQRPIPRGRLELSDMTGRIAALDFDPNVLLSPTGPASGHFIIRFSSGSAVPQIGMGSGAIQDFVFSPSTLGSALTTAGVTQLERLFPWFRPEDVESNNPLGEPIRLENLADVYVARVAEDVDAAIVCSALNAQTGVLYAEPDYVVSASLNPNDTLFPQQWGLHNTSQGTCGRLIVAGIDIDSPAAWDLGLGNPSVSIAILDTGIDNTHVELGTRAVLDTSFVPYTTSAFDDDSQRHHGTAVAGLAAATLGNSTGIAGVAPLATLHAIKVLDYDGFGYFSQIGQGWNGRAIAGTQSST